MTYSSGLNNFAIIYYINLFEREDRFNHINNELRKTNLESEKINRINAIYKPDFGPLGCAESHALALEKFIESGKNYCIIFEDDFEFTQSQETINELVNCVFNEIPDFDVLMLSSNTFQEIPADFPFVTKIIDAQTLSGYAVSKNFAPTLLNNFKESITLLQQERRGEYCVDMNIKKLQPHTKWYCINPKIGRQIASYSDNEKRHVDYGC